jgi:hypothetical protein
MVRKPDEPWRSVNVEFALAKGSFTDETQYPPESVMVETNEDGEFSVSLWCNEEGKVDTYYEVSIDGRERFPITIPVGVGDLEISILRESFILDPSHPSWFPIIRYIDNRVDEKQDSIQYIILNPAQHPNYNIPAIPSNPQKSELFVRGIKQKFGVDYVISGSVLSWIGGTLPPNPVIELYFS